MSPTYVTNIKKPLQRLTVTYLTKKTIIKIANATSAVLSYFEYLHNFANSRKISEISWHHITRAPTLVKFEA